MLNPKDKKRILVLGIGNILWADEGFGVRVVEEFHRRYTIDNNVTVLDGGTQGLYLVSFLEQADCLVVFDAIDYGLPPGQLELVRDDEVPKFTGAKKVSLHQTGFQEVLSAADFLGRGPRELALIGCQPLDVENWGGPLTAPVRFQIAPAIELACKLLARWGSPVKPRSAPLPASERLLANNIDHASYEMRAQPV
ncbi:MULTISPECIES: HyaD/HybD family hydrogenase maturation endopeptidase [Bradyrhizobium]|uniref:HyaD/HybD family hydrogenase maturation endopeptidase n=1 Tax=Bradyrhizobium TaxID=374 RepID=UPI00155E22FB|nr:MULTISPECIES: HyaD/HybD family hydrogenase maturation endopeptidase [Bradyrhizobium]MDD1521686.1 HyaD/HybD family hydrogenase maturation endopeptidase [Bradyrhizobium sp. WBAH30]MDD1546093.1 HyaD/HybD family hydrogenase maturation endopeptidase [Bradyrhizobium sp. WBAH41]MDD1559295.1 HyaD/HybD family hydrogenase maturation endopeptidase [Bradyrhizobium sp. WBAH23]MDD1566810.1 HyaD/HybD family hydrogenase maturation endopeptidase [Bradyrhizobium sp. WBAH33]MDD1592686.1 HyaD/HybD family hydro